MCVTERHSFFTWLSRYHWLCLAVLMIVGCTIQLTCDLYNNTGSEITIVQKKSDHTVSNISVAANSSVQLSGWNLLEYEIVRGDDAWKYKPTSVGSMYVSYVGFGPWKKRLFKAQIESNGQIFILNADQRAPLTDIPGQPSDFPLLPIQKETKGSNETKGS